MDTWRSDSADDTDGEVIEIIPIEEYDMQKAKARASLSWVLWKAYQDKVPPDFKDPFYETAEGNWQIKPRLANLLASSEVYCLACSHMFGESSSQWSGHWSIIQVLSRKGIYAVGSGSVDVTETILMQSAPFKLKAHLVLIDALMTALSREIASIERVTQSVRRYASFNASSELPSDTEDAILFWINKVCVTVQKQLEKNQETLIEGGETSQKVRIVSNKTPRDSISVPIMESLLKDMGDGCSLATLISFYCPTILHIDDVCLKSNVGIADSLYNLRLIRTFCDRHLPIKTCHLTYEDLLYTHQSLRENVIMMVTEIFYWFELKRLPIVTGGGYPPAADRGDGTQAVVVPRAQTAQIPNLPISNVTKQSFHRLKTDTELRSSSTPDIHRMSSSVPPRMPLLHRRQQQGQPNFHDDQRLNDHHPGVHRTNSLTSHDLRPVDPTQSVLAWQEKNHGQHQQAGLPGIEQIGCSSNLLANVSMDLDMNTSFSSGSIDLGELDNSPRHTARFQHDQSARSQFDDTDSMGDNAVHFSLQQKQKTPYPAKSEHMELESANSGVDFGVLKSQQNTGRTDSNESLERIEPLMPARLKPAKEKTNNHSKEEERGETPRRKTPVSPNVKRRIEVDPHLAVNEFGVRDSENPTPVPDERQSQHFTGGSEAQLQDPSQKKFDVFYIRGSVTDSEGMLTNRTDATVAESYVIDNCKTPEAARAAGIPIIENNPEISPGRRLSREGSIASSKSSGDFSDHESHKIHIDHKTRETSDSAYRGGVKFDVRTDVIDPSGYIIQKPIIMNRQTKDSDSGKTMSNFAQLKHMKDIGQMENSGFVYMQHGKDDEERKSLLKDTFQRNKAEKKTTFAPLPNQTSWHQTSNATSNQNPTPEGSPSHNGSASQELLKLKMKLEEKRRAIERKKHSQEIQQQKMRQRLGKAAFLHVVSKTKDDDSIPGGTANDSEPPARMTTSDSELPGTSLSGSVNSRMTSSSPMKSPNHQKIPRPFSRDDIQQTIENVRKKWFQDEDLVSPRVVERPDSVPYEDRTQQEVEAPDGQITPRPVFDRRSASVERITSLADQMDQSSNRPDKSPQITSFGRRSASVERSDPRYSNVQPQQNSHASDRHMEHERRSTSVDRTDSRAPRPSQGQQEDKPETYEEYNSSLDQLNRSLTDLQGEIMKLSLKQKKADQHRDAEPPARSRSRSPPKVLEVRNKNMPEKSMENIPEHARSRGSQPQQHSQSRSASEPRQIAPEPAAEDQIGNYQSHTLPRQPGFHHGQGQIQQYMAQNQVTVAGPAGPVYGTPNQYVPVQNQAGIPPTAQQYGSYIMGPTHQQIGQIHQPYQHSPPQAYPGTAMYPGQPYMAPPIVSPQTQPYGSVYTSPPHSHYQPLPHPVSTYTTSVLQQQIPSCQAPLFDPNTQQVYQSPQGQQFQQGYPPHVSAFTPPQQQTAPSGSQTGSSENKQTDSSVKKQADSSVNDLNKSNLEPNRNNNITNDSSLETQYNENDKGGGFFVSFNESSPRRTKPQLSERKPETQSEGSVGSRKQSDSDKYGSSVIADFAKQVAEQQGQNQESDAGNQSASSGSTAGNQSAEAESSDVSKNESQSEAVGFVIGQDDSSLDQSAEEEMLKKKERLEKMRQKRQEEQERKRQKLEQEASRKREAERLKQEESDRRKSEEKARREQIFKQYLQKKEDDEDGKPPEKSKQKTRPKSMFVKMGGGSDATEGVDAAGSVEDVSARALPGENSSAAPKPKRTKSALSYSQRHNMRKAVSCNTLNQNGDSSKSLAYGGLTHRRPPSPDLYRSRKGPRSTEGSEAGSTHSPKLFVKPSSKSNRHIIINAISHCCLAGTVNTELKNKVLEEIAKSSAKHFIILFRDTGCGFRSLYGFDPDTEECVKIMGVGPRMITNDMVEKYYKYNSGAKSFSCVSSTKHISVSIDALVLQNTVWKSNKAPAKGYR